MKLRVLSSFLLFFPAFLSTAQVASTAQKFSAPARTFRFTYNFTLKDIPSGASRCPDELIFRLPAARHRAWRFGSLFLSPA